MNERRVFTNGYSCNNPENSIGRDEVSENPDTVPEWGFVFYPFNGTIDGLASRFDINIIFPRTDQHFDPETILVPKLGPNGELITTTISKDSNQGRHFRLGPGRIVAKDHKNKEIEAFTMGGNMEITVEPGFVATRTTSPTPILDLRDEYALWFVNKYAAIKATRKARWGTNDLGFQQRLTSIDPTVLYAAALQSIRSDLERVLSNRRSYSHRERVNWVDKRMEEARRTGMWPAVAPTMDELI